MKDGAQGGVRGAERLVRVLREREREGGKRSDETEVSRRL